MHGPQKPWTASHGECSTPAQLPGEHGQLLGGHGPRVEVRGAGQDPERLPGQHRAVFHVL